MEVSIKTATPLGDGAAVVISTKGPWLTLYREGFDNNGVAFPAAAITLTGEAALVALRDALVRWKPVEATAQSAGASNE